MESKADHHRNKLHFFFLPFMAHGHLIPMIEIARLFATRGLKSTIITTPLNASLFSSTVDRDRRSGLDIGIQIIQFPSSIETELPEGCENINAMTSQEMFRNFLKALTLLQQPVEQLLVEHRPDCLVADLFFHWATDVAANLEIPRIVFYGMSLFSLCAKNLILDSTTYISADPESLMVLDLPDRIETKRSQLPDNAYMEFWRVVSEIESRSYGVLVNSFYEMEPAYVEYYRNIVGRKVWHIGPVSLAFNRSRIEKVERGQKSNMQESYFLKWLDRKKPNSVLYVSFGSLSRFSGAQLLEIAIALEASGSPFIWVIRTSKEEEEKCLPEGFEERMEGRGLIVKGWAPQLLILDHPAIGGFMTHCGWNSILEGVSAGVPLITWPLFAEQFFNQKLVTQVGRVGIEVGAEKWYTWTDLIDGSVKRETIERVVKEVMGSGGGQEMRKRAKEFGKKAKKAMGEGGSSYCDLTDLIEQLSACKQQKQNVGI